jgi:enoyl-[acyl-carrier-protein] reductase (NADH)
MMRGASSSPAILEAMANISPFKRIGTVSDIGDSVALLVSESARWISGQAILITGGAHM